MEKVFYVYILRCKDHSLYTGYTVNLQRRLLQHNQGVASKYTRARLPVRLVYFEKYPTKQLATKREYQIKHFSKIKKENLIRNADASIDPIP